MDTKLMMETINSERFFFFLSKSKQLGYLMKKKTSKLHFMGSWELLEKLGRGTKICH